MHKEVSIVVVCTSLVGAVVVFLAIVGYSSGWFGQSASLAPAQLSVYDKVVGKGATISYGDDDLAAQVTYVGTLQDGMVFDSSYAQRQTHWILHHAASSTNTSLLEVLRKGLEGMRVGGTRVVIIPPELGYEAQAIRNIPPNSRLVYEIRLHNLVILEPYLDLPSPAETPVILPSASAATPTLLMVVVGLPEASVSSEIQHSVERLGLRGKVAEVSIAPEDLKDACNAPWNGWTERVDTMLKQKKIDPGAYEYVQYVFSNSCETLQSASSVGVPKRYPASTKPLRSWLWGGYTDVSSLHALGHSLGLGHADALLCSGGQIVYPYSACRQERRGDPTDLMGNGFSLNAPHLVELGWMLEASIQKVISNGASVQSYTLNNLGMPGGLKTLQIAKPDTEEHYYVAMQPESGGASIYIWDGQNHHATKVVSLTGTEPSYVLQDGMTFTDAHNGLTIRQVSHSAESVELQIHFGPPETL